MTRPDSSSPLSRRQFMKTASISSATAFGAAMTPVAANAGASSNNSTPNQTATPAPAASPALPPQELPAPPDRQPPGLELPPVIKNKVGWAVVGLGKLALDEIMPAFGECQYSKPTALVSGHPEKAAQVAQAYGMPEKNIYNYQNFDTIGDNPEIEAVYIVLPNSMHAEYTIRALRAGKHVLCEKPMAATVEECQQMIAASKETGKKLSIAYRLHYEPLNRKVMEICEAKTMGQLKLFTSSNCQNVEMPNIRLSALLAGGPVGDVGVYSINAARYVINEEPVEVFAVQHKPSDDPRFSEVPESVAFTLRYPSGVIAQCVCSFGSAGSQRYEAIFDQGIIVMDPAFPYRGLNLTVSRPEGPLKSPEKADLDIKQINHFASEMDHFSQCIINNTATRTPAEMGMADMQIIAAIGESAASGKPVKLA